MSEGVSMAIADIFKAVMTFDQALVNSLTQQEVDAGSPIEEILNQGLIAAMDEVGEQFSKGDLFVPEMLMAAQAMKGGMAILQPLLTDGQTQKKGTVVIGTVKGDLHDIGKNLVAMMMEGAGFNVVDLGVDVDSDTFLSAAQENNAKVVALSALLTTTMPAMEATVKKIKESGLPIRVIIGGAPVSQDYANQIQADGYGEDAPGAVEAARQYLAA